MQGYIKRKKMILKLFATNVIKRILNLNMSCNSAIYQIQNVTF